MISLLRFAWCRVRGARFRVFGADFGANGRALIAVLTAVGFVSLAGASTLTVNVAQPGGELKKAGLGSLFGVVSNNVGNWKYYLTNGLVNVSEHQGRIGENGAVPSATEAVAPVLRGTQVKMMCRFGDLCYGWAPYTWPGLNNNWIAPGSSYSWLAQVTNAVRTIINSNYESQIYAIAIFNEPEGELWDTNFYSDPNIPGATQMQRIDYVWTQTYRAIRTFLPAVKIMGPNFEDYRPQYFGNEQTMMHDFLTNAIATGTTPNVIGWHNLNADPIAPGDIGEALTNYYRPLETSLKVPGAPLPVSIEEYGVNNGAFEGIPGQMAPYWAEFERDGVDFACMGIYENGGDLGNTMRYTAWDTNASPDGGWYMMNWYKQMQGNHVSVTAPGTGLDGVAGWDATNQVLTVLFGGADGDTTVQVNGLGTLGLGKTVRVRLDMANWTTNAKVANTSVACGGDPQTGGYNLYDNPFTLDASGNLAIPVNAVEGIYNGYRLLITADNGSGVYPTKYEAENATCHHVILYSAAQASGKEYVGGIDYTDSYVCFHVTAPSNGLYNLLVRYAASSADGPATQGVAVNGQSQGVIQYPPTAGWSAVEERTTSRLVSLVRGNNDIFLSHATNYAELDFIDVRPDTHRYDAELATNNDVVLGKFNSDGIPNSVGGINNADSHVDFAVTAPVAGNYQLAVDYANGTGSSATHLLSVNGASAGSVPYAATGGWLGGGWLSGANPNTVRRTSTVTVSLKAGVNIIELAKGNGYAELDDVRLNVSPGLTPGTPYLEVATDTSAPALYWPMTATGYSVQESTDLTGNDWAPVTNAVNAFGNLYQMPLPVTGGSHFFRLYP